MRKLSVLALLAVMLSPTLALAAAAPAPEAAGATPTVSAANDRFFVFPSTKAGVVIGAAIGVGLVVIGGAKGVGAIGSHAVDAIARQPEAGGRIFTTMIISAALIEGFTLFAIVVCLLGLLGGA